MRWTLPQAFTPRWTHDGVRLRIRGDDPGPGKALTWIAGLAWLLALAMATVTPTAWVVCGTMAVVLTAGAGLLRAQAAVRHEVAVSAGMLCHVRWWGSWRRGRRRIPLERVRAVRLEGDRMLALRVVVVHLEGGEQLVLWADGHSLGDLRRLVAWLSLRAVEARAVQRALPPPPPELDGVCSRATARGRVGQLEAAR